MAKKRQFLESGVYISRELLEKLVTPKPLSKWQKKNR